MKKIKKLSIGLMVWLSVIFFVYSSAVADNAPLEPGAGDNNRIIANHYW